MRTALLIGIFHGDDSPRLLAAGDPAEMNRLYKEALGEPGGVEHLSLWESSAGVTKRKRFAATEEAIATACAGFKKAAACEAEIEALRAKLATLEAAAETATATNKELLAKLEAASAKKPKADS